MPRLVVLVPVLRRPHRVAPFLESLRAATNQSHRTVFICDSHDLAEHRAVRAAGAEMLIFDGNYAAKINAGYRASSEPLIFMGADDLHFHPLWFERAAAKLADGGVGAVGTNDLCNKRVIAGEHSTHSLVARWYADLGTIDEPGQPLHEGYPHEFVDDEFVETAKARGMYAHAGDSIVEHLHPDVGKAPEDALYRARRGRMRRGRRLYHQRRPLWAST